MRRQRRQENARPLVDDLRAAIDDALRRLSLKSAMAKALAYGRKRWIALTRYLDDGLAEIDNNIAERAMRSVAIGRKNWLGGLGNQRRLAGSPVPGHELVPASGWPSEANRPTGPRAV